MIKKTNPADCCGCTACASICAHDAIHMEPDGLGFLYPKIDVTKCVECGLCNSVCQFHGKYNRFDNYETPIVYGGRHRNLDELERSQSGAGSFAIISSFLKEDGIVYGSAISDDFHVAHKRAKNVEECEAFRGSKYVQSDLRGIFRLIKDDLKNGKRVLFIGTGCQVSGLKSYIPTSLHINLLTIDIICHGVPSPAVWEAYVNYLQKKNRKKIVKANFRDKKYGWHSHIETFVFENGKEFSSDTFRRYFFYNSLTLRDSCLVCPYTNLQRVGDVTLGDFWGWEKYHEEWNDNKGVSLILVNSPNGDKLIASLDEIMDLMRCNVSECIQPQLLHPSPANPNHNAFVIDYVSKGFLYCGNKYGAIGYKNRVFRFKQKIRKSKLYKIIKRVF